VNRRILYTVGHSNHSYAHFRELLRDHGIEILVDVRSKPYSRYVPHFRKASLEKSLLADGIGYLFLGDTIGGMPKSDEFYDAEGRVLYGRYAESSEFQAGMRELEQQLKSHRCAVMCGEEDPTLCHRRVLIGTVLKEKGIELRHIRKDGSVQTEVDLRGVDQAVLFTDHGEWRSRKPVRKPTL
jgi:uncharacterized protein (DUF488 family)